MWHLPQAWWSLTAESTNVLNIWRNRWDLLDPMGFYNWYNGYTHQRLGFGPFYDYPEVDDISSDGHIVKIFKYDIFEIKKFLRYLF